MQKPCYWIGSSYRDIKQLSGDLQREIGFALYLAQNGSRSPSAVSLVGFGNAGVVEVVIDDDGNTFRAVYTVKFEHAVYVLHVFQKKSKKGIKTPDRDKELIKSRLKLAERDHKNRFKSASVKGAEQ